MAGRNAQRRGFPKQWRNPGSTGARSIPAPTGETQGVRAVGVTSRDAGDAGPVRATASGEAARDAG